MYKDTVETSSELSELELMIREQMQIDKQFKENHPEWNSGSSAIKEDSITISKSFYNELVHAKMQAEILENENKVLRERNTLLEEAFESLNEGSTAVDEFFNTDIPSALVD